MAAAAIASGAVALPDAGAVAAGTSIAAAAVAITTATASPVVATGPSCFASIGSFTGALSVRRRSQSRFRLVGLRFIGLRRGGFRLGASRRYPHCRQPVSSRGALSAVSRSSRSFLATRSGAVSLSRDLVSAAGGRSSARPRQGGLGARCILRRGCRCPQRHCCRPVPQSCHCAPMDRKRGARISPSWPEKPRLRILLT